MMLAFLTVLTKMWPMFDEGARRRRSPEKFDHHAWELDSPEFSRGEKTEATLVMHANKIIHAQRVVMSHIRNLCSA
jgi:hypothetical protein